MSRTMTQTLADIDTAVESWETAGDAYRWTPELPEENDVPPPLPAGTVRRFDAVVRAVSINGIDVTPYLALCEVIEQSAHSVRRFAEGLAVAFTPIVTALRESLATLDSAVEFQRIVKRARMRHLHTTYSARKRGWR